MPSPHNIPLKKVRQLLKSDGFVNDRTTGGHEFWEKKGLNRSICLQTHVDPVPIRIVKQICVHYKCTLKEFCKRIDQL